MTVTVHAHLRQTSTGLRAARSPSHRNVQVDDDNAGLADALSAGLPEGWIVRTGWPR